MNKPNRWIIAPVFLLAVMAATFGLADDDSLWEVTEVETGTDPEMIMTEDTFRLQFTGNDKMVHLKPLPRLRGRWGQTDNFTARLQR